MTRHQAFTDEAAKVRRWSQKPDPNISFGVSYPDGTTHSLREMAKDDIDFDDLLRVLRSCKVTDVRLEKGEWRHRAEGRDKDGRCLVFIIVLCEENEEIEIVTAWAVK